MSVALDGVMLSLADRIRNRLSPVLLNLLNTVLSCSSVFYGAKGILIKEPEEGIGGLHHGVNVFPPNVWISVCQHVSLSVGVRRHGIVLGRRPDVRLVVPPIVTLSVLLVEVKDLVEVLGVDVPDVHSHGLNLGQIQMETSELFKMPSSWINLLL